MVHFLVTAATAIPFFLLCPLASALPQSEPEIWRCFGNPINTTPAIILSTQDANSPDRGAVFIANTTHLAKYQLRGLARVWIWMTENDELNGFIIQPDQTGLYFMLSEDGVEPLGSPLICFTGNDLSPGEKLEANEKRLNKFLEQLK